MTHRERFQSLLNRREADRVGFWLGHPHYETMPHYLEYFHATDELDLAHKLDDEFAWIMAERFWQHPEGKPIFDVLGGLARTSLNQDGVFAECESVKEVEEHPLWQNANADYVNYEQMESELDRALALGMGVAGGSWSSFFHTYCDFFGMENCFVKMYTDPEVVEAVAERVTQFSLEVNQRVFERMGDKFDAFFLGNDFGTQRDLLISPEAFKRFVLPYFKKLIDQAKRFNKKVILHSCGAINKAIPMLIDAGIDALHPIQAMAAGMDAESLSQYKNDLLFVGGIDTQQLLPYGTPDEVRREVDRVRGLLGPGIIISPSHEALLLNVKPENVIAMHDATLGL